MLSCASWDGTVRAWSLPSGGKPQHVLTYRHAAPALCACWQGRDAAAVALYLPCISRISPLYLHHICDAAAVRALTLT